MKLPRVITHVDWIRVRRAYLRHIISAEKNNKDKEQAVAALRGKKRLLISLRKTIPGGGLCSSSPQSPPSPSAAAPIDAAGDAAHAPVGRLHGAAFDIITSAATGSAAAAATAAAVAAIGEGGASNTDDVFLVEYNGEELRPVDPMITLTRNMGPTYFIYRGTSDAPA